MMIDFFFYLLKVSGVFIVLYLVHLAFFSRLTFHKLNRTVLMAILPISLIIPMLNFAFMSDISAAQTKLPLIFNDFGDAGNEVYANTENSLALNYENILLILYSLGVWLFLIKIGLSIFKLIKIKRCSSVYPEGKFSIVSADIPSAFSCFHWIFLPQNNDRENKHIIEHEKLHSRLYHTFDLIAAELFIAFLWFNPFVYLFRKSLKSVHEFQIDNLIVRNNFKTSDYLRFLLNSIEHSVCPTSFCNNFNGSTLKKRVKMMTKNKSSKWRAGRYLLLIPIIVFITMAFSGNNNKYDNIPDICPIKTGENYRISSVYGLRVHPITKEKKLHKGIDFAAQTGTPIVATANGIVARVVFLPESYGKLVEINHGNGFITRYAQMRDNVVAQGDKINKGDIIGSVGCSGLSTGSHLHYEVLKNGENVNPKNYIEEKNETNMNFHHSKIHKRE